MCIRSLKRTENISLAESTNVTNINPYDLMARRFGDGPILPPKTIKLASKKQRLQQIQGDWTAAEILVSYKPGIKFNVIILGQADAYMLIYSLWDKSLIHLQEQFMAVFLNNKLQVIGYKTLYTGNMTCCCIDIRLLASLALHCMASS